MGANPTHNIRVLLYRITRNSLACLWTRETLPIPRLIITTVGRVSADLGACRARESRQDGEESLQVNEGVCEEPLTAKMGPHVASISFNWQNVLGRGAFETGSKNSRREPKGLPKCEEWYSETASGLHCRLLATGPTDAMGHTFATGHKGAEGQEVVRSPQGISWSGRTNSL